MRDIFAAYRILGCQLFSLSVVNFPTFPIYKYFLKIFHKLELCSLLCDVLLFSVPLAFMIFSLALAFSHLMRMSLECDFLHISFDRWCQSSRTCEILTFTKLEKCIHYFFRFFPTTSLCLFLLGI